jgi:hypothetical protein
MITVTSEKFFRVIPTAHSTWTAVQNRVTFET